MSAYYNEIDPFAAAWLRELITGGHIAHGDVDERSIEDVQPDDVRGYTQCHFFAGIGGWSYALRLAGWPDDRPVWTGSCPCQPFSVAGKGEGFHDPRHLWPAWFRLIRECRPPGLFGEQVAGPDGLAWFDTVSTDMEAEAYAVGAADLAAASVEALHIRQRLWFVAEPCRERCEGERLRVRAGESCASGVEVGRGGEVDGMGHASGQRLSKRECVGRVQRRAVRAHAGQAVERGGHVGGMAHSEHAERWEVNNGREDGRDGTHGGRAETYGQPRTRREVCWAEAEWLPCRDGKYRAVEPGTFPLADGVPARVGRLRGYGNAIVPQVAAEFIAAYCEATA